MQIAIEAVIMRFLWCLVEPVIKNPQKLAAAVAGKGAQLADGIAFRDPEAEPVAFSKRPVRWLRPNKGARAAKTLEALPTARCSPKKTDTAMAAQRATLFVSRWLLC